MAIIGTFKGKELVYEESVRDEIYTNIINMTSFDLAQFEIDNPDVDILDMATFLAANAYKSPNTKMKIIINGLEIVFDGTTNSIDSNANDLKDWMRGLTSATVGGVAAIALGVAIKEWRVRALLLTFLTNTVNYSYKKTVA